MTISGERMPSFGGQYSSDTQFKQKEDTRLLTIRLVTNIIENPKYGANNNYNPRSSISLIPRLITMGAHQIGWGSAFVNALT